MARQVRDASLETRNARRRHAVQGKPHWKALDQGLHLGYRKHSKGGTWVARRFNEHRRYHETRLGITDDFQDADGIAIINFSQAQEAARKWYLAEIRKENGIDSVSTGPYTVADAMRDYMAHYAVEGKGAKTTQASVDAHIIPALGKVELGKLNSKKIADWHKNLATSPARIRTGKGGEQKTKALSNDPDAVRSRRSTANRILTMLKAALNFAWKEGKIASDTPWRKIKPFKNVDAPVVRYISEAECVRLVNACPEDLRRIVQAALYTGCRYNELASLKAVDFSADAGAVSIRTSKSGKSRHVILTDEGKAFFESVTAGKQRQELIFTHHKGMAWGKSHQSRPLADACKTAKIVPAISFKILRHTHGSILAMKGVPMPVISKQLGHADTRMTEKHYAHLSPSYVADTIRQNFPVLGLAKESNVTAFKPGKHG